MRPVVRATASGPGAGTTVAASTLFSVTDTEGDGTIVRYVMKDITVGGGHFNFNGVAQADNNGWVEVYADDLSKVTYTFGSAGVADTIQVLAKDEVGFGDVAQFNVTASGSSGSAAPSGASSQTASSANVRPVAVAGTTTAAAGTTVAASTLFSVTDGDGNGTIVRYVMKDITVGGGHFNLNGVAQADNDGWVEVFAADLSKVTYTFGSAGVADTIQVRAKDDIGFGDVGQFAVNAAGGSGSGSSTSSSPTSSPNVRPVAAAGTTNVAAGTTVAASTLFSVTDGDGNSTIVRYVMKDTTVGGGHFNVNGVAQADNDGWVEVWATDLGRVTYTMGAAGVADTIQVRAKDDIGFGDLAQFNVTAGGGSGGSAPSSTPAPGAPGPNVRPVAVAGTNNAAAGSTVAASTLFSVTDGDGNATITRYVMKDVSSGGGHFNLNGVAQADNDAWVEVWAADLSRVTYTMGAAGVADTIQVRAKDDVGFGDLAQFTVGAGGSSSGGSAPQSGPSPNVRPVITAGTATVTAGSTVAASTIFTATDADGNSSIVRYAMKDITPGGGHFNLNGVALADNDAWVEVWAADLSRVTYTFGASGAADTILVRAKDDVGFGDLGQIAFGDDYGQSTATTGRVADGVASSGRIEAAGDVDWFKITLTGGSYYTARVLGSPSGQGTLADPRLVGIYNAAGTLISGTANDNFVGAEPFVGFLAPTTGTYYYAVGGAGSSTGSYVLSVVDPPGPADDDFADNLSTTGTANPGSVVVGAAIEHPSDVDWFRTTLTANTAYTIRMRGALGTLSAGAVLGIYDASGTLIADTASSSGIINYTPTAGGTYYVAVGGVGSAVGTYTFDVDRLGAPSPDDLPANTSTTGTANPGSSTVGAWIGQPGDTDWYRMTLAANTTYLVRSQGARAGLGSLSDPAIVGIYDSTGALIANTSSNTGAVNFTAPAAGLYFASIGGVGDAVGTYALDVQALPAPTADDFAANTGTTGTCNDGWTVVGARIEVAGDVDWFRMNLDANTVYTVRARSGETLNDPTIVGLYDTNGVLIENSANSAGVVNFAPATSGRYFMAVGAAGGQVGSYIVEVNRNGGFYDVAATTATLGLVDGTGTATGAIESIQDIDWFRGSLTAGHTYRVQAQGQSLADAGIAGIYDASGNLIANTTSADYGGQPYGRVDFTAPTSGTYFFGVNAPHNNLGTYTLSVT